MGRLGPRTRVGHTALIGEEDTVQFHRHGPREPYKGYILEAAPRKRGDRWTAAVIIERHDDDAAHFQEVGDDPSKTYLSRPDAERASLQFGKAMLDSRS